MDAVKRMQLVEFCKEYGYSVIWMRRMIERRRDELSRFGAVIRISGPGPGGRWMVSPAKWEAFFTRETVEWADKQI